MKTEWRCGPLPPDTWGFGGVQTKDCPEQSFLFADFRGDHVLLVNTETGKNTRLEACEVVQYNNSLDLPPKK